LIKESKLNAFDFEKKVEPVPNIQDVLLRLPFVWLTCPWLPSQ